MPLPRRSPIRSASPARSASASLRHVFPRVARLRHKSRFESNDFTSRARASWINNMKHGAGTGWTLDKIASFVFARGIGPRLSALSMEKVVATRRSRPSRDSCERSIKFRDALREREITRLLHITLLPALVFSSALNFSVGSLISVRQPRSRYRARERHSGYISSHGVHRFRTCTRANRRTRRSLSGTRRGEPRRTR